MNIARFAAAYLRQYRKLIAILCLFAVIFGIVFSLYRLEAEAVLYASILCAVVGFITLGIDFFLLFKRHRRLTELCEMRFIDPCDLPAPKKIVERDHVRLIEGLLRDNQKMRNEFSQSRRDMEGYYTLWAHQIKSPVAAMRLILQTEDSPQNAELLHELFRVEQYVEMVLSYIRLESDSSDFVIRSCPLEDIVRGAVRKYASVFVRKRLGLDFQKITCEVLTDEKWLSFVIEQVLSNALKYTVSGKITIYTEGKSLVIKDSGMGIAAEDLPRVGEKGFTGYNGRFDKRATGIGLFLCKTICKKLGHSLTIESQIGVGTTVTIGLDSSPRVAE